MIGLDSRSSIVSDQLGLYRAAPWDQYDQDRNPYPAYLGNPTVHTDPDGLTVIHSSAAGSMGIRWGCWCCALFHGLGHRHDGVCFTSLGMHCTSRNESGTTWEADLPDGFSNCGNAFIIGKNCSVTCTPILIYSLGIPSFEIPSIHGVGTCRCLGWMTWKTCCQRCEGGVR